MTYLLFNIFDSIEIVKSKLKIGNYKRRNLESKKYTARHNFFEPDCITEVLTNMGVGTLTCTYIELSK